MSNRPIGIFDSGVGGLTVLKQLNIKLPDESYLYYGDTARVPYGEKTPELLLELVREIMEWFKSNNVKAVAMACNTCSAVVYEKIKNDYDFPVFSLIEPTAKYLSYLDIKKVGVIATSATVNSRAFTKNIKEMDSNKEIIEVACPGLVELAESNKVYTQEARKMLIKYIVPLQEKGVERVVLGCTHYPFFTPVIDRISGNKELLIDPAVHIAQEVSDRLLELDLLSDEKQEQDRFFASSNIHMFKEAGRRFYEEIGEVCELNLSGIKLNR